MKAREHGTVATFNGSFCFITPDNGQRDVFAHVSQLPQGQTMHRGDRVSFDLAPDPFKNGKMCAKAVRFLDDAKNPQLMRPHWQQGCFG
jgi:cold shock protein